MSRMRIAVVAVGIALFVTGAAAQPHPAGRPAEFWKGIAKDGFTPPPGSDVGALALALCDLFASPDPELRDDVAYSMFVSWAYQKKLLTAAMLRPVTAALEANLRADIGSTGTDAVFRRSFSALALSAVVARDNVDPVLDEAGFRELLTAALQYLATENDTRGFDAKKGWMHSAAHTADLLKFLGRSRYVTVADQTAILDGILRKMTTSPVFAFGEDERHARAILSIVNRQDFNRDGFDAWLTRAKPTPLKAALPAVADLQSRQNVKNLLAKLEVLLSPDAAAGDNISFARERVRAVLKDLF